MRRSLIILPKRLTAVLLAFAATRPAGLAMASEDAHAHSTGIPVTTLLFSAINFLLFLWVLGRFVLPTTRTWVSDRKSHIVTALAEAAAVKADAERLRAEWDKRLAELDKAIADMRERAREDAERERERILEAARKTAAALRRDAERAAAYELRRTQEQLRADLVREAVRLAEDGARTNWSAEDQHRAVAEFLAQVNP